MSEVDTSNLVTVDALPEPITINRARTAVIVVDMQNDFCSVGGMFQRAGVDISTVQKAIAPTQAVLAAARNSGIRIVYLKMAFQPDLSDLGKDDSPNKVRHLRFGVGQSCPAPDGRIGRFLIRDTWNTDVITDLEPKPDDLVLYKHRFSGFYQTDLDQILRRLGVENLIFTGCTTSVCVDSTLRDAMFRDYRCVLLMDCVGEPIGSNVERTNHEASILTVQMLFGWVAQSIQLIHALEQQTISASVTRD